MRFQQGQRLKHAHAVYVRGKARSDPGVEQAGKVAFGIAEPFRCRSERDRLCVMLVDIGEDLAQDVLSLLPCGNERSLFEQPSQRVIDNAAR